MKKPHFVLYALFFSTILLHNCDASQNAESRTENINLKSKIFNNERLLRIYIPPNYKSGNDYPLLLLNDGQNVFGNDTIRENEDWRVNDIADSLIKIRAIKPLIIVGIDNIGISERGNEYLPWEDIYLNPPIPQPSGKLYPKFLIEEVIPVLRSKYKIAQDYDKIGIGGFSYGGLISVYNIINSEKMFGYALIESPSLYVEDQQILKESLMFQGDWPKKMYIGIGTNEMNQKDCNENFPDNKMAVNDVKELKALIMKQDESTDILLNIDKCAIHDYKTASKRLPNALIHLFGF